jgi:hypothetical protein
MPAYINRHIHSFLKPKRHTRRVYEGIISYPIHWLSGNISDERNFATASKQAADDLGRNWLTKQPTYSRSKIKPTGNSGIR